MSEIEMRPAVILLIDDDEADQIATKRSLKAGKIRNELYFANNGEEALDYLYRRGKFEDPASSPWPDIILLDLNMPRMDGREVLTEIEKDEKLRTIPVIVLTTSDQEEDILKSYQLGCRSYITKPVGATNFAKVINELEHYWFQVVVLPPKTSE